MQFRDLKYILAYILPLSCIAALLLQSYWSFLTVIIAYIVLPLLDANIKASTQNLEIDVKKKKVLNRYFDILLLVNLPLVYFTLFLFLQLVSSTSLQVYEYIGLTISVAIIMTTAGINVAHELGHKPEKYNQWVAQLLLLPSLYQHFFIEHNRGHHLNVGTDQDPASAKKDENAYVFWLRSVSGQWTEAWNLENDRVGSVWTWHNQMLRFTLTQMLFLLLIYFSFGGLALGLFVLVATISFTHLELINYIEHYGLRRKKNANGRYERVEARHSWNSNHEFGRIMLYELTRHSDHHYKSAKKYQILDHHEESPQLPYGYPASLLMSLVPPLWFRVMNKRIPENV